jgi:hypothetical protein
MHFPSLFFILQGETLTTPFGAIPLFLFRVHSIAGNNSSWKGRLDVHRSGESFIATGLPVVRVTQSIAVTMKGPQEIESKTFQETARDKTGLSERLETY